MDETKPLHRARPADALDVGMQRSSSGRGANLAPYRWKKGQSGNPRGKNPGLLALRDVLGGLEAREKLWKLIYHQAVVEGCRVSQRLLADRLDPVRHVVDAVIEETQAPLDLGRLDEHELDVLLQLAQKAAPSALPPRDPDPDRTVN